MTLTAPYKQHHYMGEYANDAAALTFIQAVEWDSAGNGTGTPQAGMMYFNSTNSEMMLYDGTSWVTTGASGSAVTSVFGRTGAVAAVAGDYDDAEITAAGSATNYTPGSSTVDGHLSGIDTALGGLASTSHAATHIDGGSDVIDGDKIEITWTPSTYTRTTSPSEADALDQLTAHLAGIDDSLSLLQNGLSWKDAVKASTTQDLASESFGTSGVTYANGTAGVGATLTQDVASDGAFGSLDGISFSAGDRILVKDQTAGAENGIYELTTVGDGSTTPWVLTRVTDADEAAEVPSMACFVQQGTTYADTGWTQTADSVTMGTTALTFTQFTGLGEITAGTGLSKTGNTLNVGDINRGVQVNADDLEVDASEIAGDGLKQNLTSPWILDIEPADFAGTGLEDDGADNLRLATQGDGIAGGGGTTLSVDPATEVAGSRAAVYVGADGVGIDLDNSTLEHSSSVLQVKDGGITEAKLSFNAAVVSSGAGTPNSGAGTSGNIGDIYIDTTNGISYFNEDGTATGWCVS